jgi:nicotinate-nucleotide adenylyltransferase
MPVVRLGLMGGTFDPIHFGHLFIAEEARVRCHLDEVLFIPNNKPAHREGKTANVDAQTRFEMVRLAIAANPCFQASRIEIDRMGPSYTYDTLQQLHRERPDAELFFIVGADSINEVLTWYRGAELFEMCRFVAASRPEFDLAEAKRELSPQQQERVTWLEVPGLHIASRELRRRVWQSEPIRYLTPDVVVQEIERRKLYQ